MSENTQPQQKKEAVAIELNPQEQEAIQTSRDKEKRIQACNVEFNAFLQKHNAEMGVDPKSPIGNPRAVLILK